MKTFDPKKKIRQIMLDFKHYDQKHHEFLLDFENNMYDVIMDNAYAIKPQDDFADHLKAFALSMINCAYAVLEKNESYPDYRIVMELDNMDTLLKKQGSDITETTFYSDVSKMAKGTTVLHFPKLNDLSANGFRLLERSAAFRVNSFFALLA